MITVQLRDIEDYLYECETVIDKANRVAHGVNQGRTVHKDKNYYYKVFIKIIVVEKILSELMKQVSLKI